MTGRDGLARLVETVLSQALGAARHERTNEEIRRREKAIRIFPNDRSASRLIGALLAEQNEVWQERKYSRIWMSSGIG
jgi:transposase-like protein